MRLPPVITCERCKVDCRRENFPYSSCLDRDCPLKTLREHAKAELQARATPNILSAG